jgi:transcription elongation GreA/GreB family factor
MNNYLHIKNLLYKACENFVEERNKTINDIISSNKKALLSETKSSAGDKHETGRAMLQLEMEKASQQLSVIVEMKAILNRITFENSSDIIRLGSLIITDKGNYYLAISAGKITIENNNYYAVSTSSPIGKQLLGKKVGAILPFNDAEILEVN